MADQKITQLTALATAASTDVLPIVDVANTETKKITKADLLNGLQAELVSGTNIKTINSTSLLGSGDIAISANPAGTDGQIQFNSSSAFGADSNLFWDNTNKYLGVGTSSPTNQIHNAGKSKLLGILLGNVPHSNINTDEICGFNQARIYVRDSGGNLLRGLTVSNNGIAISTDGSNSAGSMLSVKGSGSTSATTSLLVQNSAGTQVLKATDDGKLTIGTNAGNIGALLFQYPSLSNGVFWGDDYSSIHGSITLSRSSGEMRISGNSGGYFPTIYSNGQEAVRINTSQQMGIGTTSPTARLQVKGSGSTSATTSLLVQNSSGTQLLATTDDGKTTMSSAKIGSIEIAFASITRPTGDTIFMSINKLVIGSTTQYSSAQLAVDSTNSGFLPPRMTTTQKNAISSPAEGLMVMDITTHKLCVYDGTSWVDLH